MVTWSGFIAKMVELLVAKIAGKKIDLALDDRKRAARTFLRLHHLLNELETITREIYSNIDNPDRDFPRMRGAWAYDVDRRVSDLSNDFFRLSDELEFALSIFDPILEQALSNLQYSKFSLLVCAAHGWRSAGKDLAASTEATFTYPNETLMSIDFESHYQWLLRNKEPKLDSLDWPQSVLIGIEGVEMICEDAIPKESGEARLMQITKLRRILDSHLTRMMDANAALKSFIGKSFRIEDVLA